MDNGKDIIQEIKSEVKDLGNRINRFFEDFKQKKEVPNMLSDLYKEGDKFILEVELPGTQKEDIDLVIDDRQIILSITKVKTSETEEDGFLIKERKYGNISRKFTLPNTIDEEQVSATFEQGVLKIEVAIIQPESNTKKIKIQ